MTLQELFDLMAAHPTPVLLYFFLLPIGALGIGYLTDRRAGQSSPWKYAYGTLVYLACLPGIFAITMCLYHLFIDRRSFLQLNILAYFLPIFVMFATTLIINKNVNVKKIPGFDKISGLSMIIAASFITILIIQKTRIWIFIGGSMTHLLGLFVVLFIVFRFGMSRLFSGNNSRDDDYLDEDRSEDIVW